MTPDLKDVLLKQLNQRANGQSYVFLKDGPPIKYRAVQHAYDSALKRAGLYGKFSESQFIRHGMASVAQDVCGTLYFAQSITGHKSLSEAAHYAGTSSKLQERSIMEIERYLKIAESQVSNG